MTPSTAGSSNAQPESISALPPAPSAQLASISSVQLPNFQDPFLIAAASVPLPDSFDNSSSESDGSQESSEGGMTDVHETDTHCFKRGDDSEFFLDLVPIVIVATSNISHEPPDSKLIA